MLPCLLLEGQGLVKTVQFKNSTYIGDPMNAVRIFNVKQVHEIILLDIAATREKRGPRVDFVVKIADECRMPFTLGGGIRTLKDIREVLNAGAEKVALNTAAIENPALVTEAAREFGSQSIVVSIDAKKKLLGGYEVMTNGGSKSAGLDPVACAVKMAEAGAGEIFLNSIDRDGTMSGYDTGLIRSVADAVEVPVIACGGAGRLEDFTLAVKDGHASAVAAGSFFVFHGRRRAVLINFPTPIEIDSALGAS